ncbi:MAG: hypothetical protein LIO93_12810 [Bacteroidales bacterium]|nr:hypothetical protein [Bacteroidales bacterium]
MKTRTNKIGGLILLLGSILCASPLFSQENHELIVTDSIVAVISEQPNDRNVMLNAASANAGPREVNIGLPASVGGTTVLENGLPVVYFYWPEFPFMAWRMDASINNVQLLDLAQTAIHVGDVGFSVGTFDNLGSDTYRGNGGVSSNHFGLINGDLNISGPLGNGFKFTVGAFANFDPGTYTNEYTEKYFSDQTVIAKLGLTKDYSFGNRGRGSVSLLYKFVDSKSMTMQQYAPYLYKEDGKVSEIDGFKIGGDSYITNQRITLKNAFTGVYEERDAVEDYGSVSHTLDLIGKNTFDNDLNFNYIVRGHTAKAGIYLPIMTGVEQATPGTFTYADDGSPYTGEYAQGAMVIASRKTPVKSLTSLFEVGKISGQHDWNVGLNVWVYDIDKFVSESALYYQEVAPNPRKLISSTVGANAYGNFGEGNEYHNGTESKTAVFVTDKWTISDVVDLNLGARMELQTLRGDYIDNNTPRAEIYAETPKTRINETFFNKAFTASAVYKVTGQFGILGEATYNEQAGHLENYSAGNYPDLKKSKIPGAGLGVFFNHPLFNIVSKATYIQRDEYRGTVNFSHPEDVSRVERAAVQYDIQTFGWTTDVVATPFENFNLHFLFTFQAPKYKNYSGTVFNDIQYNYDDKYVTGISKVLIEIDPSYQWDKVRLWASARYFSKTYANLPNTLEFAGRWETFAGANYSFNPNLDLNVTIVNLFNQRGAQGTISGTDLLTEEQAREKQNTVMSGTYIRPFTLEFGLKYRF